MKKLIAFNVTGSVGVNMPRNSRLNGSVSYGRLEQDATLLPYAFQMDVLANPNLPRNTAQALINTVNVAADYVIAPARRLNLRAFFRDYVLNNDTPSSRWQYVTSDTANLNGTVAYVNKRISLPYAWDRQNLGAEATWQLPRRNTLTLAYEREAIDRDFREANSAEDIVRAAWRLRPRNGVSLVGRYLYGLRDGGTYNNQVTREGYWYTLSEATDANNPQLTFDNHPDMRRYDVSDRRRHQADVTLNLTPRDVVAVSAVNGEFAFSSPPPVRENWHVANLRIEIPIRQTVLMATYTFERYVLDDWQQGSTAPWVEAVGAETLLRDTSRSFQWGNLLFNLGTNLAPAYNAHIGFVGFRYRF
jgi:hypothetical protein